MSAFLEWTPGCLGFAAAVASTLRWQFGNHRQGHVRLLLRSFPSRPGASPWDSGGRGNLHEEGAQRMLEGGDRTVGIGKGGLEMGEYLRCRPVGGLRGDLGGSSGGGHRADSAVRILLWPWSKRFQMRCQVRSQRWRSAVRMASAMPLAAACLRNCHRAAGGQAESADFVGAPDAEGTAAARACIAVAAKDAAGATVFPPGWLSSKPRRKPCRISVPTTLQCGQGISLSRSASVLHSLASGQTSAARPRRPRFPENPDFSGMKERGRGGVR